MNRFTRRAHRSAAVVGVVALAASGAVAAGATAAASGSAGSGSVVRGLHPAWSLRGAHNTASSYNWSGYVVPTSSATQASASWTVPAVSSSGYSSTWVGVDGDTDKYLVQTGTVSNYSNGKTQYFAWWEVITPSKTLPEEEFTHLRVSPGQVISAQVQKASSGEWTMTIHNQSTGVSASKTYRVSPPGASAEYIEEDTDVDGFISQAPDWHTVTFQNAEVDGSNADLTSSEALNIVDPEGVQEDSTGAPNSSANGFSITWLAAGTPTPAV